MAESCRYRPAQEYGDASTSVHAEEYYQRRWLRSHGRSSTVALRPSSSLLVTVGPRAEAIARFGLGGQSVLFLDASAPIQSNVLTRLKRARSVAVDLSSAHVNSRFELGYAVAAGQQVFAFNESGKSPNGDSNLPVPVYGAFPREPFLDVSAKARERPDDGSNGGELTVASEQLSCVVISDGRFGLTQTMSILVEEGFQLLFAPDAAGEAYLAARTRQIRSASFCLTILRERPSARLLFELGLATALGSSVLAVAERDAPPETLQLPGVLYLRPSGDPTEAIRYALDQLKHARRHDERKRSRIYQPHHLTDAGSPSFREEPRRSRIPNSKSYESAPPGIGALATSLRSSFVHSGQFNERLAVQAVSDALQANGVLVVGNAEFGSRARPDLAVWVEELGQYVGNPLPIEIRRTLSTFRDARELVARMAPSLGSTAWLLLLYWSGPHVDSQTSPTLLPPNVIALSIEAFFSRLENESFISIVRHLRNQRVHGLS